uniref:Uncharacterized protein n=1 Tax=Wuchereria bancrofti TaxID=6293 RepID=A0AAF5PLN8_WUCBA
MSATIILSARPTKEKLEALLKEVQEMDLTPLEQMLIREEQHEARKKIIEERTMHLKLHISTLETINTNWIQYIQQVPATKRKEEEEEDKYAQMVEDKRATERILRQLEAMGENLEQSSIEIIIENKLPAWILDRIYQQKEEQKIWSVAKLRQFLVKLIQRNEEVTRSQFFDIMKEQKESKSKIGPRTNQRYFTEETSALTVTTPQTNKKANMKISRLPLKVGSGS